MKKISMGSCEAGTTTGTCGERAGGKGWVNTVA
jgi:hypothetical protein